MEEKDSLASELLHLVKTQARRWFIAFIVNLEALMSTIRKMLSELYHTCTTDEKEVFTKYLSNLEDIVQTANV